MKRLLAAVLLITCIGLVWSVPATADITVGLPAKVSSGSAFPFGFDYNGEYQQVYAGSAFSGPITITGLNFFNTQIDYGATQMHSGTWTISLSTTSATWNTLSSTFSSNIGADNTQVFSGDLGQPWTFGKTLSIILTTPYTYDPSKGNLLMDVHANTSTGDRVYFDYNDSNTIMGRVYAQSGGTTGIVESSNGLVTGFSTTAVPLPAAVWLLGSGLIGLIGIRRFRK